jgi:hypothetical protein
VIHFHTSPPKPSCFLSSRAGIGNLAHPARSAAPKGRPVGSRGQEAVPRLWLSRSPSCAPFGFRSPRPRATKHGGGRRAERARPRSPGRGRRRRPVAGT